LHFIENDAVKNLYSCKFKLNSNLGVFYSEFKGRLLHMGKYSYIDLFAGCGGLSLGLYNSNQWHGLFAVEKNHDAFQTLKHNLIDNKSHFSWPDWLSRENHDIDELLKKYPEKLKELRGQVDLVVGGPPCQGFSLAGRRLEDDNRNSLVLSYLKMIELVQPQVILFENVKGFSLGFIQAVDDNAKTVKRSRPMSEIVLEKMRELGYEDAQAQVIDFSKFGVPQSRKRFIIVATRNNTAEQFFKKLDEKADVFKSKKQLKEVTTLSDAISDLYREHGNITSPDTNGFKAGKYGNAISSYQKLMRLDSANKFPDSHRFVNHKKEIKKRFQNIIDKNLSSAEIRKNFETKKSSTKLLDPGLPTPTLTTLPDDYIHYCEPRILTVREYARIQSFPDWYEFKGKYTTGGPRRKLEVPRYSQIGNAIPPLFGEIAGEVLTEILC
jgi:DNA (cytosine-5)-methyltransferase 1